MSRFMLFATLGVLVVLLGFIKLSVNKATDPPPPPDPATLQAQSTAAAAARRDKEAAMLKMRANVVKKQEDLRKKGIKPPSAPTPQINDNWFTEGKDGNQGVPPALKAAVQAPAGPSAIQVQAKPGEFGGPPHIAQPSMAGFH